ncbi:BTB/POZ protein [Cercophora newfieldiana]|uniref:Elongin-C n=1 Tax=Cercophora newfieldiana TaxID=92897 RepID=A0AA39YFN8_9PEZI|nr:BTB/POZ protein [Cercophora newfieldiana]
MAAHSSDTCNSKYVTLVSTEGFEYVVLREATLISPTIKSMLRGQFSEAKTGRCVFPEISGLVMEKIVEYFHYWYRNQDKTMVPDMEIPVDLCLELLVAADFLGLDKQT